MFQYTLVSSAKSKSILLLIYCGKSFMNTKNRRGSHTDPCCTPLKTNPIWKFQSRFNFHFSSL